MARRLFFVEEVRGGIARIEGDAAHHLTRVLRVAPGQRYEISDNRNLYLAEVETAHKSLVSFRVVEALARPEPTLRVALYVSLVRFERIEWLIEKATELGAASLRFVQAERGEKGLGLAATKRMDRWRRIAREACEQSRRVSLPDLLPPVPLTDLLADGDGPRLLLDEDPSAPPLLGVLSAPAAAIHLLSGPEGGWTDRERGRLVQTGWTRASLGTQILRSETAALAALAVVNAASLRSRHLP